MREDLRVQHAARLSRARIYTQRALILHELRSRRRRLIPRNTLQQQKPEQRGSLHFAPSSAPALRFSPRRFSQSFWYAKLIAISSAPSPRTLATPYPSPRLRRSRRKVLKMVNTSSPSACQRNLGEGY